MRRLRLFVLSGGRHQRGVLLRMEGSVGIVRHEKRSRDGPERYIRLIIAAAGRKGLCRRVKAGSMRSRVVEDTPRTVLAVREVSARNRLRDLGGRKIGLCVRQRLLPGGCLLERQVDASLSVLSGKEALLRNEIRGHRHGLTQEMRRHAIHRLWVENGEKEGIRSESRGRDDSASR